MKITMYFLMCGSYSDFKQFFIGDIIDLEKGDKIKIPSKKSNSIIEANIEIWKANGIYKDKRYVAGIWKIKAKENNC